MRNVILIIAGVLLLMSCGKGGSNKNNNGGGTTTPPSPAAAILTSPAQNAVCTTGNIISDTLSSITFTWDAAANTDSYDLTIKNLLTNALVTQNTTNATLSITLARNTPFSWYITSKSTKSTKTTQSDIWKFYNSGPGIVTYAPYPAEIVSPTYGEAVTASAGTVNLSWIGSVVDKTTITSYDVYFGTTNTPAILKSSVTDEFLNNVSVTSGTIYYWKVITKDTYGNTSDSGLYEFKVN